LVEGEIASEGDCEQKFHPVVEVSYNAVPPPVDQHTRTLSEKLKKDPKMILGMLLRKTGRKVESFLDFLAEFYHAATGVNWDCLEELWAGFLENSRAVFAISRSAIDMFATYLDKTVDELSSPFTSLLAKKKELSLENSRLIAAERDEAFEAKKALETRKKARVLEAHLEAIEESLSKPQTQTERTRLTNQRSKTILDLKVLKSALE